MTPLSQIPCFDLETHAFICRVIGRTPFAQRRGELTQGGVTFDISGGLELVTWPDCTVLRAAGGHDLSAWRSADFITDSRSFLAEVLNTIGAAAQGRSS